MSARPIRTAVLFRVNARPRYELEARACAAYLADVGELLSFASDRLPARWVALPESEKDYWRAVADGRQS